MISSSLAVSVFISVSFGYRKELKLLVDKLIFIVNITKVDSFSFPPDTLPLKVCLEEIFPFRVVEEEVFGVLGPQIWPISDRVSSWHVRVEFLSYEEAFWRVAVSRTR